MANRGDFNAALPRFLKRLWTLGNYTDSHQAGDIKRSLIGAHKAEMDARNKKSRRGVDTGTDNEE
jgi:hypothetical protein